ncbi:hypothetical protein [Arcanobacterium bovis]|uniref:hypothetical protein n=1 Tax=Arcanobacterium bovis TaxID=2529275 RepID=UPI0013F15AF5
MTNNDCSSWKKVIYQNHLGYDEVVFLAESKYFELQEMPSFYENLAGGVPEYTRAFCEAFPTKTWFQKDDGASK